MKKLRRLLIFVSLLYLGIVIMFVSLQRSLIYAPTKGPVPVELAHRADGEIEEVTVQAEDGNVLHGWHTFPASPPSDSQRMLVIWFPGNAGNRAHRADVLKDFNDLDCETLLVDYRGYGENAGKPSEPSFQKDARAVWNFATKELKVPANRIVICGESLGGGVATQLVWSLNQEDIVPAGLVLRATFTSLTDAGKALYPWLPVRTFLLDRYPSIERIPEIKCPVLVMHGDLDEIVPYAHGQALFAAAPAQSANGIPKTFVTLHGAGHNNIRYVAGPQVTKAQTEFLNPIRRAFAKTGAEDSTP